MKLSSFFDYQPPAVQVHFAHADSMADIEGFEAPTMIQVLAPTNRAVAVLRAKGVTGATTIHSAIYRAALQQPRTRHLVDWLKASPEVVAALPVPSDFAHLEQAQLAEARAVFRQAQHACQTSDEDGADQSALAAAMRAVGLDPFDLLDTKQGNGGWVEREQVSCKVRIVDESSMLTLRTARDVAKGTRAVLFVGDPRQLDPVINAEDVRAATDATRDQVVAFMAARKTIPVQHRLTDPMRQAATPGGQGILDVANWVGQVIERGGDMRLNDVWQTMMQTPGFDIVDAYPGHVLREAPAIVWLNTTRLAVITRFREAMGYPPDEILPGEPLVLNWIRGGKEAEKRYGHAGLVRNSNWTVVQGSEAPTWCLRGADGREVTGVDGRVAEFDDQVQKFLNAHPKLAASPWARFKYGHGNALHFQHGAATTAHRAQGGEWDEVAISAADLTAYSRSSFRHTTGAPAWLSWLYTAMTRARHTVYLVTGDSPVVNRDFLEH